MVILERLIYFHRTFHLEVIAWEIVLNELRKPTDILDRDAAAILFNLKASLSKCLDLSRLQHEPIGGCGGSGGRRGVFFFFFFFFGGSRVDFPMLTPKAIRCASKAGCEIIALLLK